MRTWLSSKARRITAALLLAMTCAAPVIAQELLPQELLPYDDPDEGLRQFEPPPSLPEGLMGTIRPKADAPKVERIDRINQIFQAVQACWQPPAGSGFSGQEITLRMSFKRSGEVLGQPRITYYKPGTQGDQREPFTRSVREAFERCTPFAFTESLGRAVAGRIFSFRFIDARPM
jgi:hypothetical protein